MNTGPRRKFIRSFAVIGLLLGLLVFAGSATAQDILAYPDNPIYGAAGSIDATVDLYLPISTADLLADPAMRRLDVVNLPAVMFVPALSPQEMAPYVADLTGQGYAVAALDYRPHHATADALCAMSWLHTFAPVYGLDENRIVAFGYAGGGQVAALLGAMNQTVATAPDVQAERCPWAVPEAPMVEGVATFDAELGTSVALVDTVYQTTVVPPADTTRAELIAAYNKFAVIPAADWAGVDLPELEASVISTDQVRNAASVINRNPDWVTDIAISLPVYWLDGDEPRHLLMVGDEAADVMRSDNLAYDSLLRELGVPVQLTEMANCGHDPCALIGNLEPLHGFLAEVFAGS